MTDTLILGDRTYSSWSMRAWLLADRFGIDVRERHLSFADGPVADQLAGTPPARTVPALVTDDGAVIADSLAIAEELATRHPDAPLWPARPRARATARSLAAEMHSGFADLRDACPMNLRVAYGEVDAPDRVRADLSRIEAIWSHALGTFGGPWLCGDYSVADAFFAPVAARIAGYDLPVGPDAAAYVAAHLADTAFRRWRAMAMVAGPDLSRYAQGHRQIPWPGPASEPATPAVGPAVNETCPYSGKPVTHFLGFRDRVWGFCNPFCRDRTAADPTVWPAFTAMVEAT